MFSSLSEILKCCLCQQFVLDFERKLVVVEFVETQLVEGVGVDMIEILFDKIAIEIELKLELELDGVKYIVEVEEAG